LVLPHLVVQEVAVAKKTLVICGKYIFPWKVIRSVAKAMMADSFPEEAGSQRWMNIPAIDGVASVYMPNRHHLLSLLMTTLHTEATDPRDKLYGLFGIVKSSKGSIPSIKVDSLVPVKDLYRDVARFLILGNLYLTVFQMHGLGRKLPDLPSWVPNWSVPGNLASIIKTLDIRTEEEIQAVVRESSDPDEFLLGTERLDVVRWTGMAVARYSDEENIIRSMEAALRDWVTMVASLLEIKSTEPGETKAESFWQTIIANMDGSKDDPP
jgi:hypothetical protein